MRLLDGDSPQGKKGDVEKEHVGGLNEGLEGQKERAGISGQLANETKRYMKGSHKSERERRELSVSPAFVRRASYHPL